jgi:hypothetical protein
MNRICGVINSQGRPSREAGGADALAPQLGTLVQNMPSQMAIMMGSTTANGIVPISYANRRSFANNL